jgi:hypothetical protein
MTTTKFKAMDKDQRISFYIGLFMIALLVLVNALMIQAAADNIGTCKTIIDNIKGNDITIHYNSLLSYYHHNAYYLFTQCFVSCIILFFAVIFIHDLKTGE